jgi:hypothetical protein
VLPACQDPCVWLVLKLESHVYGKKSTLLKSCLCFCIERLFQPLCAWVPIMERILESRCWEEFGAAFLRRQFTCLRRFCPVSLSHTQGSKLKRMCQLSCYGRNQCCLLWKDMSRCMHGKYGKKLNLVKHLVSLHVHVAARVPTQERCGAIVFSM